MWEKCYKGLESTKQYSVWMKIKVEIDKLGKEKLITQMKHKLRNLKDLYKQAKDNNKKREGLQCFPLLLGLWLNPRYQRCYQFPLQQRLALQKRFQILQPIMRILKLIHASFSIILIYPLKGHLFYRAPLVTTFVSFSRLYKAKKIIHLINPYHANLPYLYPLTFVSCFMRYEYVFFCKLCSKVAG